MTERVKSPYDTGTGYIHRQCEEREDALRATIRGLEAENARLRDGIAKFLDYQQGGAAPGEWSYTLADLRDLVNR